MDRVNARPVTLFVARVAVIVIAAVIVAVIASTVQARAAMVPVIVTRIETCTATLSITRLELTGRARVIERQRGMPRPSDQARLGHAWGPP